MQYYHQETIVLKLSKGYYVLIIPKRCHYYTLAIYKIIKKSKNHILNIIIHTIKETKNLCFKPNKDNNLINTITKIKKLWKSSTKKANSFLKAGLVQQEVVWMSS